MNPVAESTSPESVPPTEPAGSVDAPVGVGAHCGAGDFTRVERIHDSASFFSSSQRANTACHTGVFLLMKRAFDEVRAFSHAFFVGSSGNIASPFSPMIFSSHAVSSFENASTGRSLVANARTMIR